MTTIILDSAAEAIDEVRNLFVLQPASFLYESDIQSLLFARLFDKLSNQPLRRHVTDKRWKRATTKSEMSFNPVKTEYPSGRRFDIAVISENTDDGPWWDLHVCLAIEIKLWQIDHTGGSYRRDLDRLRHYKDLEAKAQQFTGLSLVFCHNQFDAKTYAETDEGYTMHIDPPSIKSLIQPNTITAIGICAAYD